MPKPHKINTKRARLWRVVLAVLLLGLGAGLLAAHWQTVTSSLILVRKTSIRWLVLSLLAMAGTFCLAAGVYGLLALKPLRYRQTIVVEVAAAFANRLLPAGLGGLGLHGVYLYRKKHTPAQATAVVSVNNLLGITAHLVLLAFVVLARPGVLQMFVRHYAINGWYVLVALLIVLLGLSLPWVRRKLSAFGRNLAASLRLLRPRRVLAAAVLAMLLTAAYTCILFASAHGVGLQLGVLQTFIVFSAGLLVGTATPTPGGLVGTEAGLFAGFVGYGVSPADATAATLLFRLVTYWLPLLPGVFALLLARARKLV